MPSRALTVRRPWEGRGILLGVTGGIAAYKAVQVARDLTRLGARVDTVLTEAAARFVAPLSFEGVTGRGALQDLFSAEGAARHLRLGAEADAVCIAPATADFIARTAQGRANDLLTTTLLATRVPVLLFPAMNDRMWDHPQTRANAEHLTSRLGYEVVGPAVGPLAFGEGEGPGRMVEPEEIVEHLGRALARGGALDGLRIVVTAGPTREPLDPVRFLGNRSSGRMGYALARAAWRRGAEVALVSGPVPLSAPPGLDPIQVETAREMEEAVARIAGDADVVILSAAVSDYRPARARETKMKRGNEGGKERSLTLVENPDIARRVRDLRRSDAVVVGFALETDDLLENARKKLSEKEFNLIVANDATEEGAGFEVETNRVTLLEPGRQPREEPLLSKEEVAERILDRVEELLREGS